jgi:type I site-specific restriction endonuclease
VPETHRAGALSTEEEKQSQLQRLADFHARHAAEAPAMLQRLQQAVIDNGNVFEVLMDAVRCAAWARSPTRCSRWAGSTGAACPFKRGRGRVDYLLRAFVGEHEQPLTLAFVEAKKERLPPTQGVEQVKAYARRFAVKFVYSTNGHQFIEYDVHTGLTSDPRPMAQFPSPVQLRERWFAATGLNAQSPALAPLLTAYHASGDRPRY